MNRRVTNLGLLALLIVMLVVSNPGAAIQAQRSPDAPDRQAQSIVPVDSGFTYQGQLKQSGSPTNGQYDFTFKLFDALAGGIQAGPTLTVTNQTVTNGLFTVTLDFGTIPLRGQARWLEIGVRPAGVGGYTTLAPRQPLTPAPYAMSLMPGAVVTGTTGSGSSLLTLIHSDGTGLSATGTDNGLEALATSSGGTAVSGTSTNATSGTGVYGASVAGRGVWGMSLDSNGQGVYGQANVGSTAAGVYGTSSSGYGVYGTTTASNGQGVFGQANLGTAASGVHGASSTGRGVSGSSTASGGHGVHREANSSNAVGVYGYSVGSRGVHGESSSGQGVRGVSSQGIGVYGSSQSTGVYGTSESGSGVEGSSTSEFGEGVYGSANAGLNAAGVYGFTTAGYGVFGSGRIAIYGDANAAVGSRAGYFAGDVEVTGDCCGAAAGYIKMDHPLDPANKYLSHSLVSSDEMKNIYDGVAVLDERGEVAVELPSYFEALNSNFRYTFAPIGAPMPNLYIAEEITNNRFKIAGGKPGMKVSWQVTGVRKDPYASAHPVEVEEAKSAEEQGKYRHPEEYGRPETLGVDYEEGSLRNQRRGKQP
jgi:hypothetical protein